VQTNLTSAERRRADQLFEERYDENVRRVDKLFVYLMLGQWIFGIGVAAVLSPYAWSGKTHVVNAHVYVAVFFGAIVSALPIALGLFRPGWLGTRLTIACGQMLWSALLIHLTGGRIETHFHVFGSLAFLAFYRDWRVLVPATLVVAADHFIRQQLWPESVYGILAPESWRFLEHAFWVAFEDTFLAISCVSGVNEMRRIAAAQAHIELTDRLEREMEIASRIQTSILPRNTDVTGLEIAAKMIPSTEIGGDYYEILPVEGGCWIGIGDVAGHGLKAGLVMLQAQSAIEALVKHDPNTSPRRILRDVNRVLFENVRKRLDSDEHVTMSLYRYYGDGRLVTAGAHEEAVLWRAGTGKCERVPIRGTWLGAIPEIESVTVETAVTLERGDLLILYTDGLTEGRNPAGEEFGLDRVCACVEAVADRPSEAIRDHVLAAAMTWTGGRQDDDVTLLIFRHRGVAEVKATG
jgi:serine phosphatase RsbU (regulator of sigma subunit)